MVQNQGWELSLATENFSTRNFRWSTNLNITLPNNKLVRFTNLERNDLSSYYTIGKSVNIQHVYNFLGVDPLTGVYQVADRNGNPTLNPILYGSNSDALILINTDPKFYGGFQNTFTYKSFQFDFLFSYTKQLAQDLLDYHPPGSGDGNSGQQPVSQLDRWKEPGDAKLVQKYGSMLGDNLDIYLGSNNLRQSNAVWVNGSYIRLRNVSLSWQAPNSLVKILHLKNCKFYFHGQNLLTITNYKGLDPESKSSSSLPPLRVFTFGLQIGL